MALLYLVQISRSAVSFPYQNTNYTKIKTGISRLGEFYFFFFSLFPYFKQDG